jgi:Cdc6-like AAA superfamily ATPase
MDDEPFKILAAHLSKEKPIRSNQFLRARTGVLAAIERELRYFNAIPFFYGYRDVGKTSLARTAAQLVTKSDREHIYVACAPGAKMLQIFREVCEGVLKLVIARKGTLAVKSVEVQISLNPTIKAAFEQSLPKLEQFTDANAAIRARYGYKRFSNLLMRGHVRLQAEHEEVVLGREPSMYTE